MVKLYEEARIRAKLKKVGKKIEFEEVLLDYCRLINKCLKRDPDILFVILETLGLDEEEFFNSLSTTNENIVFYDQTLSIIKSEIDKKLIR